MFTTRCSSLFLFLRGALEQLAGVTSHPRTFLFFFSLVSGIQVKLIPTENNVFGRLARLMSAIFVLKLEPSSCCTGGGYQISASNSLPFVTNCEDELAVTPLLLEFHPFPRMPKKMGCCYCRIQSSVKSSQCLINQGTLYYYQRVLRSV